MPDQSSRLMPPTARGESAPATSPVIFTEEGFRVLLRSRFSEASPATTASNLAETLDVAPDTAIAWVYGLYATVLGRLPQNHEILPAANRLRSGETANGLVEELLASDEAMASGGDRPTDLGVAYITGCYLCVLGRRPDTSGLQHHLDFYASGGSPHVILQSMLESEEASSSQRFPPPSFPEEIAIAQALQAVVLGQAPIDSVSRQLADRYLAGESVVALIRDLWGRDQRLRARIRAFRPAQPVASQVLIEAKLRQLLRDFASDRAWEWRGLRRTWRILGELQDGLDAQASHDGKPGQRGFRW